MMLIKCIILIYFLIIFNRIHAEKVAPETLIEDKIGENKSNIRSSPRALPTFVDITDKPDGNSKKGAIVIKDINITYHLNNCNKSVADLNFKPHWKPFVDIPKQNPGRFDRFNFGNNRNNRQMMAKVEKLIESSECVICRECLDKFRLTMKFKRQNKSHNRMFKKAKLSEPQMVVKPADRSQFEAIYGDPREMNNKREKREEIETPKAMRKRKSRRQRKSKKNGRSKKRSKSKSGTHDGVKERRTETITSITKLKFENIKSEILQVNETERQVVTSKVKGVPDKIKNITSTCNLYQVTKLMSCASPEASKMQLESLRNTLLRAELLDSKYETTAKYESVSNMPSENTVTYTSTTKNERNYESNQKADKVAMEDIPTNY